MRLIAEAQPSCDPETLRERMPEALAFVREWVHRADGLDVIHKFRQFVEPLDASLLERGREHYVDQRGGWGAKARHQGERPSGHVLGKIALGGLWVRLH